MLRLTRTANACALALLLTTSGASAASTLDFNKTCDDVLKLSDGIKQAGQNAWTVATQKLSYCDAAKDSKSAASKNGLLWKVWAGVAGVCTTACIGSFFSFGAMSKVCTYSDIGAGVTDAAVTKDFMTGLTAIGGALAPKLLGKQAITKSGKGNIAACLSAATATMAVFTKKKAESQAKDTMNGNLESAAALGPVDSVMGPTKTTLANNQNNVTNTNVVSTTHITGGTLSDDQKKEVKADACDGAASSGDTNKVTSCALAADKNLPGFVAGGPFNQELTKDTGQSLGGFVKNAGENPTQALGAASGLTGEAASQYGQLLAAAAKAVDGPSPSESTYAGGGGGAPAGGGGAEPAAPDFAGLMAKMMGKGGKDEKGDPQNLKFSGKPGVPPWLRGPASEDDRAFSLFDRVTYRYYFVGRRIIFDEDQAPPSAKR